MPVDNRTSRSQVSSLKQQISKVATFVRSLNGLEFATSPFRALSQSPWREHGWETGLSVEEYPSFESVLLELEERGNWTEKVPNVGRAGAICWLFSSSKVDGERREPVPWLGTDTPFKSLRGTRGREVPWDTSHLDARFFINQIMDGSISADTVIKRPVFSSVNDQLSKISRFTRHLDDFEYVDDVNFWDTDYYPEQRDHIDALSAAGSYSDEIRTSYWAAEVMYRFSRCKKDEIRQVYTPRIDERAQTDFIHRQILDPNLSGRYLMTRPRYSWWSGNALDEHDSNWRDLRGELSERFFKSYLKEGVGMSW